MERDRQPTVDAGTGAHDASTDGMAAGYDRHSGYQQAVADAGTGELETCLAALQLPAQPGTLVAVDLGAATGANSARALGRVVRALRRRDPDLDVACVHNDVLTNDWGQLFTSVATAGGDGYLAAPGPQALPMASARSFFEPVVPTGSAHVEISFSAAHWLRSQPQVGAPAAFYPCEATGSTRAALAAEAAADWQAFVTARAADLADGGVLFVEMVGTEGTHVTARELLRAMAKVAGQMAADGLVDPAALAAYVFPVYPRTVDEVRAPFDAPGCELELLGASTAAVPNPYLATWHRDGDAAAYARSYVAFVRGFTESTLRRGLFDHAPAGPSADALVEDYYGRLERRFAADPEADAFRDWTLTVAARRRPRR